MTAVSTLTREARTAHTPCMTPKHSHDKPDTVQVTARLPRAIVERIDKLRETPFGTLDRTEVIVRALAFGLAALERKADK